MNERVKRLEEKVAHLERHVTEQDKAMLEFATELDRLRRELRLQRDRLAARGSAPGDPPAAEDRPPHF